TMQHNNDISIHVFSKYHITQGHCYKAQTQNKNKHKKTKTDNHTNTTQQHSDTDNNTSSSHDTYHDIQSMVGLVMERYLAACLVLLGVLIRHLLWSRSSCWRGIGICQSQTLPPSLRGLEWFCKLPPPPPP